MTLSTTCPACGATMWRGSLHCCPRRNEPPAPGSSIGASIAWIVFGVVIMAAGALILARVL